MKKIQDKRNTKWQKEKQEKGVTGKKLAAIENNTSMCHSSYVKKSDNVNIIN